MDIELEFLRNKARYFYEKFSAKLEIFDPLDRDIKTEPYSDDEDPQNQAIKCQDLLEKLNTTEKIRSEEFRIVIPNNLDSYKFLQSMFKDKRK